MLRAIQQVVTSLVSPHVKYINSDTCRSHLVSGIGIKLDSLLLKLGGPFGVSGGSIMKKRHKS